MSKLDPVVFGRAMAEEIQRQVASATGPLIARIAELEAREVVNGKDGRDGIDGKDGADGGPGNIGLPGKDGKNGTDGDDGIDGVHGKDGDNGIDGKDGAPGRDGLPGVPGRDGVDGLGFDDLDVEYDGERSFKFILKRGERVKEFEFVAPVVLDRGVWKQGSYEKADGVTWAGSFWIAQKDTASKPDGGNSDWRLAIKRGRDGKDAKQLMGAS